MLGAEDGSQMEAGDGSKSASHPPYIPARAMDTQLKEMLADYEHYRVWEFTYLTEVFPTFESYGAGQKFERLMKRITDKWCCAIPPRGPKKMGYVWLDMYWDVTPHVDRFGRKWKNAWHPIMGSR